MKLIGKLAALAVKLALFAAANGAGLAVLSLAALIWFG